MLIHYLRAAAGCTEARRTRGLDGDKGPESFAQYFDGPRRGYSNISINFEIISGGRFTRLRFCVFVAEVMPIDLLKFRRFSHNITSGQFVITIYIMRGFAHIRD
jgi:hypothetical protein